MSDAGFDGTLWLKDRACPDCGQPRIVGHDGEGNDAWSCVNPNCPPEIFGVVGELSMLAGDLDTLHVADESIVRKLQPFVGERVYLSVRIFGKAGK